MLRKDGDKGRFSRIGDKTDSFREHDELMKRFRLGHPEWPVIVPGEAGLPDWLYFLPQQPVNIDRLSNN